MNKLLYLDIETSALNVDTWSPWESNAIVVNREWQVLGFAYAWDDGKPKSVYPKSHAPANEKDEKLVLKQLWDLLDEADIVIAHNGDKFDLKKINARLVYHGFGPPSRYRTIDTLKQARKHFAFTFNRLDYLGQFFDLGGKMKHDGYAMWQGCVAGDKKQWLAMARYNRQDITLLRDVYMTLRGWMTTHPHLAGEGKCPICESDDRIIRQNRITNVGIRKIQYQCKNCGGYHTEGKPIDSPDTRV